MLDIKKNLQENMERNPQLADFLSLQGFVMEEKQRLFEVLSLGDALRLKKLAPERFVAEFERFVEEGENQIHHTAENQNYLLYGRIPCVVQLPVQDALDQRRLRLKEAEEGAADYNIALAEFGKEWLVEAFAGKEPPVLMGTGIEGMVSHKTLMGGAYSVRDHEQLPLHPDFAGMEDPKGIFRLLTGIPLVMVIDGERAGGREIPDCMEKLLDAQYEGSIVYPDDGHMLDSIMLTYFYRLAGYEGIRRFRANSIRGAHPSQMIKPGGIEEKPFVMLMPWIFAEIKAKEEGMCLVWPKDGAPILPLVITKKADCDSRERELFDFLIGEEVGTLFRGQGFFPSACGEVKNGLPGKLQFVGWEFLYQSGLEEIIKECRRIMEE